jgi:hypothetical protein
MKNNNNPWPTFSSKLFWELQLPLGEWRLPIKLPKIGKLIKLLVIAKAPSTLELESLWSSK